MCKIFISSQKQVLNNTGKKSTISEQKEHASLLIPAHPGRQLYPKDVLEV